MRLMIGVALLGLSTAPVAEPMKPLEELMTQEEYAAAGLERLRSSELAALRDWIEAYADRSKRAAADTSSATAETGQQASTERAKTAHPPATATRPSPTEARSGQESLPRAEPGEQKEDRREIRTRITGDFNGWSGDTVFELENGQVWQQRQPARLQYQAEAPRVIIRRNFLGFYSMEVPEAGRSVLVRQLR